MAMDAVLPHSTSGNTFQIKNNYFVILSIVITMLYINGQVYESLNLCFSINKVK